MKREEAAEEILASRGPCPAGFAWIRTETTYEMTFAEFHNLVVKPK
jgi:hypothetical protein